MSRMSESYDTAPGTERTLHDNDTVTAMEDDDKWEDIIYRISKRWEQIKGLMKQITWIRGKCLH